MSKSELGLGGTNPNFKPSAAGAEARALASLVNFINDPRLTGQEEKIPAPPKIDAAALIQTPVIPPPFAGQELPPATPPEDLSRIFFSGKLGVGKDFLANAIGAKIFGFADAIYALAETFFGIAVSATEGKDKPGVRQFLQAAGNWGRGDISEQYPLTPARANFIAMVRSGLISLPDAFGVKWGEYGLNKNLWVDATLARVEAYRIENPGARVAITNCRFPNEHEALQAAGFVHYHVACSPATWAARLAKRGLKPDAPVLKDLSERLAHQLDADVTQQLSRNKFGKKLHCIWNDPSIPTPSSRLLMVAEFTKLFESAPVTAANTGE